MKIGKTTIRAIASLTVFFGLSSTLFAQDQVKNLTRIDSLNDINKEIKGYVINSANKKPIQGARISAYGKDWLTALSNEEGLFSIKLPAQETMLIVTAQGYNRQLVSTAGTTEGLTVSMHSETFSPDYRSSLNATNHAQQEFKGYSNVLSVDDELSMKMNAELRTIRRSGTPGVGNELFTGGFNSLNISSQPLIVLDGIVLETRQDKLPIHDGYFNNIMSAIDVEDIESIELLKNGTSLYGAKGSRGVLIINTKRSKSMVTKIDVSVSGAVELKPTQIQMMNSDDFRLYASDILGRMDNGQSSYLFLNDDEEKFYYSKYHNNTNWSDYTYRNALSQKYHVTVRGGDQVAMYNLSLGFSNAQSTLNSNDFQRLNLRFNTDLSIIENLDARFDVSYSNTRRHLFDDGAPADYVSAPVVAPGFLSLIKAPILSPYKYDNFGNLTSILEGADDYILSLGNNYSYANPLSITQFGSANNKNYQQYDLFTFVLTPKYKFSKNLVLSSDISVSFTDETEKYFMPMTGVPPFIIEGKGEVYNHAQSQYIRENNLYADTRLSWNKRLKEADFHLFSGIRIQNSTYKSNLLSGYNTGSDKMPNITGSLQYEEVDGSDDTWRSLVYYANTSLNLKNKYLLEGTLSLEGSSRFGKNADKGLKLFDHSWGLFPSIQTAWVVSAEEFMKNLPFINFLKLNAGFDISGNDNIDNYASRAYFQAFTFLGTATGLQLANIGNSSVAWESTSKWSAGIELNAFNNFLNLRANLFHSTTDNLITQKSLRAVSGLEYYWSNEGALQNQGFDLSVNAKLLNKSRFKWSVGASVGHYKNEITQLPDDKSFITTAYGAEIITQKSSPAGLFWGYKTNGVFPTSTAAAESGLYIITSTGSRKYFEAGDMIFVDNGDKVIDENDKTIIGDPNPDIFGNINTMLSYGNWSLHLMFKYSYGNEVYNYLRSQLESGSMVFNQSTALNNRWKYEGQDCSIPKAVFGDPMGNSRFSDRWIEDGSYLKLSRLCLSYSLPVNSQWMQGLSVYASCENLFSLSKYLGTDPETSYSSSVLLQGIDRGLLSSGKTMIVGLKISL
jgi:TonB-linked SusC/RagA family outer membrane protein